MKTVLLSIPKSLNSTIEFIRNLVQVILELLLRQDANTNKKIRSNSGVGFSNLGKIPTPPNTNEMNAA